MRSATRFASHRIRYVWFAALTCLGIVLAAACGGSSSDTVTVQLDWTPNTNHIGIYVAQAKGWYKDAGIKVKILPYTDVNPDTVIANGKADIGFSFPPNVIFSRAAGLNVVSVAAVMQTNVTALAVLDSSDIKRPRDFDGKVYAGFGLPYEEPQIKTVIQSDGGKGTFTTATLSTAAYDALYNKRADFTEVFTAWEGIEADMAGIKLRTFRYADYGVPDHPSVVLIASGDGVSKNASKLQKFMAATQRGYEYAAQNPADASEIFLNALPKDSFPEPDLVRRSTAALAPVFLAPDGHWGVQDAGAWQAYAAYMVASGVVTDDKQKPIKDVPAGLFTNQLLSPTSTQK